MEVIVSLPILWTVTLGDRGVGAGEAELLVDAVLAPAGLLEALPGAVLFAVVLTVRLAGVVLAGVASGAVVLAGVAGAGPLSVRTETTGFWPGFSAMTVVCVPSSTDMTISFPTI